MKTKYISMAMAALIAAGGLWLTRLAWRAQGPQKSSRGAGLETPHGQPKPGQILVPPDGQNKSGRTLRPPVPNRRFTDFTPEQRVEFARKGHGPGG